MNPNDPREHDAEGRLRTAFQRARVPAAPPALRAHLDELTAQPIAARRSVRRPVALLAAAAIAIVVLTGTALLVGSRTPKPSPRPSPSPAASVTAIIPWVDRPAAQYVPTPTPPPFPTDARPCQAADLKVSRSDFSSAAGNANVPVHFLNVSTSACVLEGEPTFAGVTADGKAIPIHARSGSYFGDPGPPANIAPGDQAALNVSWAAACEGTSTAPRSFAALRIGLPNRGGSVDVHLRPLETICGLSVSRFGVPALASRVPEPSISPLTARIDAPATVAPGTTLSYTVTLTNPSPADVTLAPCPSYAEAVGSASGSRWVATVRYYELNCDTVRMIRAGASVTFEMRLALPNDQIPSSCCVKFNWYIQGDAGPFAGAPLEIAPTAP